MTKNDTIAEIRRLNPSALAHFLEQFSGDDLTMYLRRLWESDGPAGNESRSPIRD